MRATIAALAVACAAAADGNGGGRAPVHPPSPHHPPVHALRGTAHDAGGALCLRWDLLKTNGSAPDRWRRRPWHNSQNAAWEPHADPASLPVAASCVSAVEQGFRNTRRRALLEGGGVGGALGVGRQLYAPGSSLARQLQPGGGGATSGSTASTACSPSSGTCTVPVGSTSSASTTLALSYSTTTGKFTGTITTNQCPKWPADYQFNGTQVTRQNTASCIAQTFPAPAYTTTPIAAPLRGRIGLAVRSGENIYGPLDAGFSLGFACTNGLGSCASGTDITMCASQLEYECGTSYLGTVLMSDCGNHASPLHLHEGAGCEYDENDASTHSTLVGVMLDGRGLYGRWEAAGALPSDLDACNGHYGPVPATTVNGVTYPAATSSVYHYHVTSTPPYFAGCFGPASNLSAAMALYPATCGATGTVLEPTCTSRGWARGYKADCPVYRDQYNATASQLVPDADCPVCAGACAAPSLTASATPSKAAGASPSATATASWTTKYSLGPTPAGTPTRTASRTGTVGGGGGGAATSASGSGTPSAAATGMATVSASAAATGTPTGSASPASTGTATTSGSGSASPPATGTASGSGTPPPSVSASPSPSTSASGSPAATGSGTGSGTPAPTTSTSGSGSASGTPAATGTGTPAATGTGTAAATRSGTAAATSSGTAAATGTPAATGTATASTSASGTSTPGSTATTSPSRPASPTSSRSRSPSSSRSPAATATPSPTGTGSRTRSKSAAGGTPTATRSRSPSRSRTPTATASGTRTRSPHAVTPSTTRKAKQLR